MESAGRTIAKITGALSKPPMFEETANGYKMCTLIVGADNGYLNKEGEWIARLQEIPVKFFSRGIQRIEQLHIGVTDLVDITAKISGREWNGKYYAEVVGDDIALLERGKKGILPSNEEIARSREAKEIFNKSGEQVEDKDDLPF